MTTQTHQELLQKYAEAIVKVGLNIRAGQRLIINNATSQGIPPAGRDLVLAVTKAAYAAGARYVQPIWGDEEMLRIRLQNAPADSFTEYPKFHVNAVLEMIMLACEPLRQAGPFDFGRSDLSLRMRDAGG